MAQYMPGAGVAGQLLTRRNAIERCYNTITAPYFRFLLKAEHGSLLFTSYFYALLHFHYAEGIIDMLCH